MSALKKEPQLRFFEFEGEWEEKKLMEFSKINPKTPAVPNEFRYIDLESVNKGILTSTIVLTKERCPSRAKRLLRKEDILFQTVRPYQKNNYFFKEEFDIPTVASTGYAQVRTNECPQFLYHLLHTDTFAKEVFIRCTGTNYPAINPSDLKEIGTLIPSLSEQQKIASFLIKMDEKIEIQREKVEQLKVYKKGLLQQLFSQTLRFPEFKDEWEKKRLGEIGEFKTSSVDKLIKEDEQIINLVNYMDVYKHLEISNRTKDSLMKVSAKDSQIKTNNLLKGDILFTPSSETPEDIGHSVVIFEDLENTLYSYHLIRYRPNIKLDIGYSNYFCNVESVRSQIVKFATGSTRFTVSINEFGKVVVKVPSLPEQQKVADCLSLIDEKIELEQARLAQLEAYKKGLLQQMFV